MNIKKYFSFYNETKIIYKMIVGSVIFIIPIGVLLYFTISGFDYHIDFAKRELMGVQLLKPIKNLINYIPEYSFMKEQAKFNKDAKIKTKADDLLKIKGLVKAIDKQFNILIEKYQKYSVILELGLGKTKKDELNNMNPINIFNSWKKVQMKPDILVDKDSKKHQDDSNIDLESLSLENIEKNKITAHTKENDVQIQVEEDNTINNLNLLLTRIGNKSKLLHDPVTASYRSMDTALLIMPNFHFRMIEFKTKRMGIVKKSNTKDLMREFSRLSYELQSNLEKINKNNPIRYKKYDNSISGIIQYLESIANKRWFNKKKFQKEMDKTIKSSYKFWGEILSDLETKILKRKKSNVRKKYVAVVISLLTFVLAFGMAILISFGISVPLKNIIDISEDIANGKIGAARDKLDKIKNKGIDFDTSKNELHKLLQSVEVMTVNIDSLLTQITKSSAQVTASATQIAGSARQLEATVAEQASSTNEITTMSKEISKTSNLLSETMENVSNMAVDASEDAQAGNEKILSIKNTMETLLSSSDEIADKLAIIRSKTDNINKVIATVTKVANQTNLLSLNAAIEAEKAGEYGIGFAVVAREIRRLADQTAVATLDIEDMITEMKVAVNDGANSVEKFSSQVKNDSKDVNSISDNISGIIAKTSDLGPEFEEVYKGMQLQAQNSDQINETMTQLNEVAVHTRDSAVEFKNATDILDDAIKALQDEVTKFLVGE